LKDKSIRVQTSSTHRAQILLLKRAFEKYGEVRAYLYKHKRGREWFIYVDLNDSFKFLLNKPKQIPPWILNKDEYFYQFLTAYSDCEGNWHIAKSHKTGVRFAIRIRSSDKTLLEQLKEKLISLNYNPVFYLERPKGSLAPYGRYNHNIYNLTLYRKKEVIKLTKILLFYSKHDEKIMKMNFFLKNKDKSWEKVRNGWLNLKSEIAKTILK